MRILVTGGNGSIGRDLVPALLGRGDEVVVLDRELCALQGHGSGLELIEGSVEDRAAVARALRGVSAVVHLAWSFSDDPGALIERDLLGQQVLLELCRAGKISRFVLASSAVVYGKPLGGPIDEHHPLRVLEGRTAILITHRASLARIAHQVITLESAIAAPSARQGS